MPPISTSYEVFLAILGSASPDATISSSSVAAIVSSASRGLALSMVFMSPRPRDVATASGVVAGTGRATLGFFVWSPPRLAVSCRGDVGGGFNGIGTWVHQLALYSDLLHRFF